VINLIANSVDFARLVVSELVGHLPGAHAIVTDPAYRLCAAPGCRRRATDGQLCRYGEVGERGTPAFLEDGGHFAELARWLHDIEDEARRLSTRPSLEIRWDRSAGGSLASHQSPVVLDAVVQLDPRSTAHGRRHDGPTCARCWHDSCKLIRADADEADANAERLLSIEAVLSGWADLVRSERLLGQPAVTIVDCVDRMPGTRPHGPAYGLPCWHPSCSGTTWERSVPLPFAVRTERQLLTRHLDWIAEHDWIDTFRTEIGELRAQLQRANRNEDAKPLTGYCYRVVDDAGTVCRGSLWPVYTSEEDDQVDDDVRLRPREVVCDRNPSHRWKGGRGGDLARLSLILEEQRRADAAAAPPAPVAPPPAAVPRSSGLSRPDRLDDSLIGPLETAEPSSARVNSQLR
jgi:hypothetical protein